MKLSNWTFLTVVGLLLSCSSVPSFYLLVDNDVELANLTGVWEGEFATSIPEKYGSIFITITATQDTAFGEVVLSWHAPHTPQIIGEHSNALEGHTRVTQVIKIVEIFFKNGNIGGLIEPYREPKAGYLVTTQFQGRLSKDTMKGTFQSNVKDTRESYTGNWKVTRLQEST